MFYIITIFRRVYSFGHAHDKHKYIFSSQKNKIAPQFDLKQSSDIKKTPNVRKQPSVVEDAMSGGKFVVRLGYT